MIYASRFFRLLEIKMAGPDVLLIQQELKKQGHDPGNEDGIFGERTAASVKAFQVTHNLSADGIVGPDTWQQLNLNKPSNIRGKSNIHSDNSANISININTRQLYFQSPSLTKTFPVAVGKPSTPSPPGNWVIVQKTINPGGPFGARWMRLNVPWGGYGIHGTNRPSSIGTAASHGCIRMYNQDVIDIYDLTPLYTPVYIYGSAKSDRVLGRKDQGPDVKELQKQLNSLGYYMNKMDGIYGARTEKAVIGFQHDGRIISDGVVSHQTRLALQKALDIKNNDFEP